MSPDRCERCPETGVNDVLNSQTPSDTTTPTSDTLTECVGFAIFRVMSRP